MTYPEDRTATVLKHHIKSTHSQGLEKNRVYVTPSRSIFVGESVVKGVLPQVLDEVRIYLSTDAQQTRGLRVLLDETIYILQILSTRAMLKKAAKQYKKSVRNLSPAVLRQLEARQLALKYVANVTYGYSKLRISVSPLD